MMAILLSSETATLSVPPMVTASNSSLIATPTSNGDVYEKTHDELDFEFLGNVAGKPWRFQTNLYGNGSTHRGREERYRLWFDPTKDFGPNYKLVWSNPRILVDESP
ncbi:xyloglucan endotransglucosylase/hydrolase [Trifolium pratense]|uniref:Xyloglucan endotransglucosylase/hydrolase n=1 Tax=Trifolium pratense TaxID=57577 RepID=A0A2K3L526_TRIPR|nr:xyloglucan endotransglucosylase/hydrolase [Trifolium pratense]